MEMKLKEVADLVEGEVVGDPNIVITGVSGLKEAKEGDISFLANSKYQSLLEETKASAVIVDNSVEAENTVLIKTDKPSSAFTKVVDKICGISQIHPKGIDSTAIIGKNTKLGKNVAVGPYSIIGDDVVIGDNTIIYGGVYIGDKTVVGNDSVFYPQVVIRERISIGSNVIIHSGTVIGSDGFGFNMVDGIQQKIPQIGTVVVEDDVEIGANVTIDRARFDKTFIGKGTKIDNLVQIAHNVIIGQNCIIVAQTGVSGSTVIGKNVILAGQSGIVGHITVGDGAIVAAQSGVTKSVEPNTIVSGYPATLHSEAKKINANLRRLPGISKKVKELEEKIIQLEERLKNNG